jgi:hypothetical protein
MRALVAHAWLVLDILSMQLFVWAFGRNGELLDSHLFFYVRYTELADYHQVNGRTAKAARLAAIAEAHYQAAPGDDDDHPPRAAAMAMPVPRPPTKTEAVSTRRMPRPPAGRAFERTPPPS